MLNIDNQDQNIQNVDLAQQPPQDNSVLTIDEIRQ